MKTDDHDIRKDKLVDAQISNAEDKAQVAAFGKAAYEAYRLKCGYATLYWRDCHYEMQCAFVAAAQAVLDEARRCEWL